MRKLVIIALLVSIIFGISSLAALAEDKVQRVGKNAILGWTEVPKAIVQVTKDSDNPFLGITVGLLKGIANAFARTTSGLVDVVTLTSDDSIIKPSMVEVSRTK